MISCVSGTVAGRLPLLQRMVKSVRESVGTLPYEIVLVPCACGRDTLDWIKEQGDCVSVVREKAEGSGPAFNDGFARVTCGKQDGVVTLNDDIAVDGDTLARAYEYLQNHPRAGQVAFAHKYQNRKVDPSKPIVQKAFGYPYAQCGMTRKWLGDLAGWCGDYTHYGWDNHISAVVWEAGYEVVPVPGCSVIDWEHNDATRERFSDKMRAKNKGVHPDAQKFMSRWKGRLPPPAQWIPARINPVLIKAAQGNLRTMRFKAMMGAGTQYKPRTALIDAFSEYGPATQANQTWAVSKWGLHGAQQWFIRAARKFQPDLIMLQAQRPNNITPKTASVMRREFPGTFIFNWDADTHYPLTDFHAAIARAVHLQLTISPDLFDWYMNRGAENIGYWPIAVEQEFLDVDRYQHFKEEDSLDVLFLGNLYGMDIFPEAATRRDAVLALYRSGLKFQVLGSGWITVGIETTKSLEDFKGNPARYSRAKMALSISQTKELWGYTSDRAYNIMASGCPLLIQRFSGMEEHGLVDGRTCIAWSTFPEMLKVARWYRDHPVAREDIGASGKRVLLKRHTWDIRVKELFGLIARLGE